MNKQTEEALRMAIEGYEQCLDDLQGWAAYASEYFREKWDLSGDVKGHEDKINACKAALQEYALERMADNARELGLEYCKHGSDSACKECYMENVEQEPVAFINVTERKLEWAKHTEFKTAISVMYDPIPLYTRPTKPLSDDEIHKLADYNFKIAAGMYDEIFAFARAIEAKLMEINS